MNQSSDQFVQPVLKLAGTLEGALPRLDPGHGTPSSPAPLAEVGMLASS
jgi:hypothetical protein